MTGNYTTTDAGIPAPSDAHSLTLGPDGPILLQDHYLIEQMAQFNRERIPERQPHAKGGGAFGHFEVTNDVSAYTRAAVFAPGSTAETLIRFSTVAGERGSPDTWRDPRGFSLKLYTSEGNLDLVGNNTPVFFMRDPLKFQHFIRSQKRRVANNLRDNNMQWDFWTLSPETAHQVTWLMGDRGIPKTWRHMNGYGSHTYSWINAEGEIFWVKYHFKTDQGVDFLTQDEADRLAGVDADYHQRDLYEAIERGEHPSWSLKVQIMPFEDVKTYRFNPFDLTKVWPHGDYPLIDVGTLTLDRNVADYHTEIEQAAFEPNNLVPGTGLSPDKMLRCGSKMPPIRCMRRTPTAARRRTRHALQRWRGTPTVRWSARRTRCAQTTTTGVRPVRWSARSSTTPRGNAWPTTSLAMCPTVCSSRCAPGCSSTGATSTPISARRSKKASAPTSGPKPTMFKEKPGPCDSLE